MTVFGLLGLRTSWKTKDTSQVSRMLRRTWFGAPSAQEANYPYFFRKRRKNQCKILFGGSIEKNDVPIAKNLFEDDYYCFQQDGALFYTLH